MQAFSLWNLSLTPHPSPNVDIKRCLPNEGFAMKISVLTGTNILRCSTKILNIYAKKNKFNKNKKLKLSKIK